MSMMTDETANFDPADIQANKGIACLSYIGILFLIPLLTKKDSPFARFHVNQGIATLILTVVVSVVASILAVVFAMIEPALAFIPGLLSYVPGVFLIMGIVFAVTGKAKRLPIVGNITIVK